DIGRHHRGQLGSPSPERAYALPLQVSDAADAGMGEQLVTASMHAGDDGDRQLHIGRDDVPERQVRLEIELALPEAFQFRSDGRIGVADIGEPLAAQQRLADIWRGETNDRSPAEPDGGGSPAPARPPTRAAAAGYRRRRPGPSWQKIGVASAISSSEA